jgi:recombinational DNA repair ATPase RecF
VTEQQMQYLCGELMDKCDQLERMVQDENRLMTSGEILQLASDLGEWAREIHPLTWAIKVAEARERAMERMQQIVDKLREADPDAFDKATR